MKKYLLFFLLCFSSFMCAQIFGVGEDFENGISNWNNTDGSTTMLTHQMYSVSNPFNSYYLLKTCDGSNTAVGEMSVVYNSGGNLYDGTWGIGYELAVKNDNNFPLYIRLGFKGDNNAEFVTLEAIEVPALSDWTGVNFWIESHGFDLELIDLGNYVPSINGVFYETMSNVAEIRIIHNSNVSFDGEIVTGSLKIDDFDIFLPLSVDEKFLNDINVFPNPVKDYVVVNFPYVTQGTLTLTSIDGRQLLTKELNTDQLKLDLSPIKSKGIYFLKIETTKGTITKKIVKA